MHRGLVRGLSVFVLCGVPCLAGTAHAADPSAEQLTGVEDWLRQGIELRRAGKDAEALSAFRRAAELDPDSARVQAHLGVTSQALGRWLPADAYLSAALARRGDPYVERHRATLERAEEVVKEHIGSLAVEGGPAGAEVSLNGRVVGKLPLQSALSVEVGAYLMEVALAGHYTVSRPVTIGKRALTREAVELMPHRSSDRAVAPASERLTAPTNETLVPRSGSTSVAEDEVEPTFPRWVPWTLAGASVAAAAVAGVAWAQREQHAERWNDNSQCRNVVGSTRESLCGSERDQGRQAQTLAIAAGSAAVALAAGAIWTALAGESKPRSAGAGLEACALNLSGWQCFGRF